MSTDDFATLTGERHLLAEGVLWDDALASLWWTDIHASRLWRFDPDQGATRHWDLPQRLCCFALTAEPGVLLAGLERGLARLDTRSGALDYLLEVEAELPQTRLNDGRCDRLGNFVFGTLNEGGKEAVGSYYRYTAAGELQRLELPKVAISNSTCFSPDGGTMYFCNSPEHRIMACDYDARSGEVARLRVFAEVPDAEPDGATVDAEGYLWSAQWGGSRVVRYAPDGRIDLAVALPASQTSCVSFAGTALDRLCVTSASVGLGDEQRAAEPLAGAVFYGRAPRGRGLPEVRYGGAR